MQNKLNVSELRGKVLDLIRRTSCELPEDVHRALREAAEREEKDSIASAVLHTLLENVDRAAALRYPLCQDTGLPYFRVHYPAGTSVRTVRGAVEHAVKAATAEGILRPNAVDSLSGVNSGDNTGTGIPAFRFTEWDAQKLRIACMLKGGGSENVSAQYSLPDAELFAGRDLQGVARCVVDAVLTAQGKGCAPGIIGVGIGGDRMSGMARAKEQLFRPLDEENPDSGLRRLERALYRRLNELGIGPMGLGGKTTVLGVRIGSAYRIPASYFVSVSYMCWACRRAVMEYSLKEK